MRVHEVVVKSQAQKDLILSGRKTTQVFLKNFCAHEYQVGDKIILHYPLDMPIGAYEVIEARERQILELTIAEALDSGYTSWTAMYDDLRKEYANLQAYDLAIVVKWRKV